MIRNGDHNETTRSSSERIAAFREEYAKELGHKGITAASEEDAAGYPSNIDEEGNYIITVEQSDVPAKPLKRGDIGFNPALDEDTPKTYQIPGSDNPGSAGARNE